MQVKHVPLLAALVLVGLGPASLRPSWAQPGAGARGDGSLILIGGALRDQAIYREIVSRAGGIGQARIGIISEASRRYAGESAQEAIAQFRRYGANASRVELDPRTGELRNPGQLNALTCLFFTGGDQDRLRAILRPYGGKSPGFRAIEHARRRGMVIVAGTSAGAAVQVGPNMIIGGESYEALRGKAEHESDLLAYKRGDRPGLGFFPYGVVDTHCSARGREGRMTVLAAATRQRLAFGVGEDTALVVGPSRGCRVKMSVIGKNGISIMDLSRAEATQRRARGEPGGRWSIRNLRFSYLTDGDRLVLGQDDAGWSVNRFQISRSKPAVTASLPGRPSGVDDIFSSYRNHRQQRRDAGLRGRHRAREFVRAAQVLFGYQADSTVAGAFEDRHRHRGRRDEPVLQVGLRKDARAAAFGSPGQRSVTNLRVDFAWKRPRR